MNVNSNKKATKAVGEKLNNLLGITEQEFLIKYAQSKWNKSSIRQNASSHSRLLYFQRLLELLGLKAQLLIALDLEQTLENIPR